MNMFKKNGGFTLVELIVVIAILAILAGVAIPVYSGYIKNANKAADVVTLDAVKTAAVASQATVGGVGAIQVTANGVNINGTATVNDGVASYAAGTTGKDITEDENFLLYFNGTGADFTITLKTGTTAIWDGTTWYIQ